MIPRPRRRVRSIAAPRRLAAPVLVLTVGSVAAAPACSPAPSSPDDAPLTAPFTVSDHFAPTGYMGDGTTVGLVNMQNDACPTRPPGAVGDCYRVDYTPSAGWAGVYWQWPANNWGAKPGRVIAPGVKHVTVWARGERGGEKLEFHVGGIKDQTLPYHDALDASTLVTLTPDWRAYTVNFGSKTYDRVIGAFAWIAHAPAGAPPVTFYLDAITWDG